MFAPKLSNYFLKNSFGFLCFKYLGLFELLRNNTQRRELCTRVSIFWEKKTAWLFKD